MLVLTIDGAKGRQDRCSHRAGGSRLASALFVVHHDKSRSQKPKHLMRPLDPNH